MIINAVIYHAGTLKIPSEGPKSFFQSLMYFIEGHIGLTCAAVGPIEGVRSSNFTKTFSNCVFQGRLLTLLPLP